jgi:hypothetical protein
MREPQSERVEHILRAFEAAGAQGALVTEWPGNAAKGWEVTRFIAPMSSSLVQVLAVGHALSDWWMPEMPGDLHFLRPDGSVLIGNTASERRAWLEVDDGEWASLGGLREELGLRPRVKLASVHDEAAWAERGSVDVRARLGPGHGEDEVLWCNPIDGGEFEVCCIPFQLDGVGLGDVVEAGQDSDGSWLVERRSKSGGHGVIRVQLLDAALGITRMRAEIHSRGSLTESAGPDHLVIDNPPGRAIGVERYLEALEEGGKIDLWFASYPDVD